LDEFDAAARQKFGEDVEVLLLDGVGGLGASGDAEKACRCFKLPLEKMKLNEATINSVRGKLKREPVILLSNWSLARGWTTIQRLGPPLAK
jgi:hypothetical protein